MTRTVFLNGDYLPETEAKVSVFDRGFLMADGVYEVTSVLGGKLIDFAGHCVRLARSLSELEMKNPHTEAEWLAIHRELVARNGIVDGMIYLQVTRGNPGDRDFAYPGPETEPTVVLFTQSKPGLAENPAAKTGWKVISIPDIRWGRRDIKTVQLLYPSMCKMMAQKAGVDKFAHDMEHDLRGTGVAAVSIWMGPLVTERSLIARETNPEQYEGFIETAENPEFTAHIIDAIDRAPDRDELSGQTLIAAEVAQQLGITDRGNVRPSYREMLGSPRPKNPAAVY